MSVELPEAKKRNIGVPNVAMLFQFMMANVTCAYEAE